MVAVDNQCGRVCFCLAVGLAVTACHDEPGSRAGDLIAEGEGVREMSCGCVDEACASAAESAYTSWFIRKERTTAPVRARGQAIVTQVDECERAHYAARERATPGAVVARLSQLRDRMCGCRDRSCAESLEPVFADWQAFAQKADEPATDLTDLSRAYAKCEAVSRGR